MGDERKTVKILFAFPIYKRKKKEKNVVLIFFKSYNICYQCSFTSYSPVIFVSTLRQLFRSGLLGILVY